MIIDSDSFDNVDDYDDVGDNDNDSDSDNVNYNPDGLCTRANVHCHVCGRHFHEILNSNQQHLHIHKSNRFYMLLLHGST
jgi:hypothetical protein